MNHLARRIRFQSIPALLVLILIAGPARAATINVPANYPTISEALNAANPGDEIVVAPGVYQENVRFPGFDIILRSSDPASSSVVAQTIIDGGSQGSVVVFAGTESPACQLKGFTIQHGRAAGFSPCNRGGGIRGGTETSPTMATISDNVITGNTAWDGGGIVYCDGEIRGNTISLNVSEDDGGGLHRCNGLVVDNHIVENMARDGGGLAKCDGTISGNLIELNFVHDDGGGLFACEGRIEENTVRENFADDNGGGLARCNNVIAQNQIIDNDGGMGGAVADCDGEILNNQIMGNESRWSGGALALCDGVIQNNLIASNASMTRGGGLFMCAAVLVNNTITSNSASSTWEPKPGGGLFDCRGSIRNCIVWGNAPDQTESSSTPTFSCIENWTGGGPGNISTDPQFVSLAAGDYHLQSGSPCVDAGANGYWAAWPQRDLDGNCRWLGPRVDMGCYEFGSTADTDGDLLADAAESTAGSDSNNPDTDGDGLRDGQEIRRGSDPTVVTPPSAIGVPLPIHTIQEALGLTGNGDQIIVSAGLYTDNLLFLGNDVILQSTDPTSAGVIASTIIDGSGVGSVVTFLGTEGADCVLAGFTIRNGSAVQDGGGVLGGSFEQRTGATIERNLITRNLAPTRSGGGLAFCGGHVQDNEITSNSALQDGGGMYACDGVIQNNLFAFNRAMDDGGAMDDCDGIIQNNLVHHNVANDLGGGLSGCDGSILNNTIVDNIAHDRGGGLNHCWGLIRNCIIWENEALNDNQVLNSNPVAYCCVSNAVSSDTGIVTDDPMFVDSTAGDYRLLPSSPCLDAGVNYYWYAWPLRDFDGNCRLAGNVVDIGCYEIGSSPDSDGDLLADADESARTTDPQDVDTDGDGLRDGLELWRGSNPLIPTAPGTPAVPGSVESIQKALCVSMAGDEIVVSPGEYVENVHLCGPDVVLRGTDPTNATTVDSTIINGTVGGSVVTLMGTETAAMVVEGLTIAEGKADHGGGIQGGLSLRHSLATIRRNVIRDNYALRGGGGVVWCDGLIESNTIQDNLADNDGGGASQCHGIVRRNTVVGNDAAWDGGGLAHCDGLVEENLVTENHGYFRGGGIGLSLGTIRDNTITSNTARHGGGLSSCGGLIVGNEVMWNRGRRGGGFSFCDSARVLYNTVRYNTAYQSDGGGTGGGFYDCDAWFEGNLIDGNFAQGQGGGLNQCHGTFVNNQISSNTAGYWGGGLSFSYSGTFMHNTVVNNKVVGGIGGGLGYCRFDVFSNCIVWGNVAADQMQIDDDTTTPSYSCIQDNSRGGIGNISAPPRFVGATDFHLQAGSPCIDAGMNVCGLLYDLDRAPRRLDGDGDGSAVVDMGACEYAGPPPAALRSRWSLYD